MNNTNHIKKKFAVTTPLYYVNDVPHIGSAYTTMIADVIARFERLQGNSVLLITGTDEHGQKIQRTAEAKGLDPQEHCDQVVNNFLDLWEQLNIQWDRFIRTSNEDHHKIVKEFFERVNNNGDIYLDRQQGWYCVSCEEFKEKKDLVEDGFCSIHTNKKAEWRDEENYFFRLSKYQKQLEKLYQDRPDFIQPGTRRNEVLSFVKQGLKDFSISRINLDWGFPLPNDPKQTIYVWFDALLGYVSALVDPDLEPTLENAISSWWPINLHLIGKDILRFHAVYWPAMLMSAQISLPQKVFAHGFLTKDGQKMGKTLGNTIDPVNLIDKYGSDAVRYYFLKEVELGQDGDFNEKRFVQVLNADLANDLGNLLNRTLGMAKKYCQSKVPNLSTEEINQDNTLKLLGADLGNRVANAYQSLAFVQACEEVFKLIRASNKFIDEQAPWRLYKEGKQKQVEQVLYSVLESIRLAAYFLSPIVPNLSGDIYKQLGFDIDFNNSILVNSSTPFNKHRQWGMLPGNQSLSKPQPIFARLDPLESSSSS
ncbi:MAG: methionine--tRNA ligase [Spirulinaceae cyanobacterium]